MNLSFLKEKKNKYIIWILLGVLVLVMAIPTGNTTEKSNVDSNTNVQGDLEERLKNVLSSMEGVGEVEVMITTQEKENSLFETENVGGEVLGVVVVAQGAGTATVDKKILEAVEALFGIEAHKISIVKMKSMEVGS